MKRYLLQEISIYADKVRMRNISRAVSFAALFSILISFQNCSPVSFNMESVTSSLKADNGSVFDGKPTYYQNVPNYQCEGQPAPRSFIQYQGDQPLLTVNQNDHCGALSNQAIDPKDIDSSRFDAEYIGYRDGIYQRSVQPPDPSSPIYNEAWCQSDATGAGAVDVAIRFDEQAQIATSKIYFENNGQPRSVPFFQVSRSMTDNEARYSAPSFSLVIDRSQPAPEKWWYFSATLNANLETGPFSGPLRCRMQAGKLLSSVQKLYVKNGDWNSYVQRNSPTTDLFRQPDVSCTAGTKFWSACFHGGDKLIVRTEAKSCAELTIADALHAFQWICEDHPEGAIFYSSQLATGHSLSDLVTSAGWKPNFVQVTQNQHVIYESIPMAWWKNQVLSLPSNPVGAAVSLNQAGAVYVLEASASSQGYSIDQSGISVVIKPGAILTAAAVLSNNCSSSFDPSAPNGYGGPSKCLLNVSNTGFAWVEGTFDTSGSNAMTNLKLTKSSFLRLQNIKVSGSVGYGIYQYMLLGSIFDRVSSTGNQFGLVSTMSEGNLLNQMTFQNNTYAGLIFSAWDNDNTIVQSKAVDNGIYGFEFSSTLNLKAISLRATNHPNAGILLEGFTDNAAFDSVFLSKNNYGLDINRASSGNQYGNHLQNIAVVGNNTGLRVLKSTGPTPVDQEYFQGSFRAGNVKDCQVFVTGFGAFNAPVCPGSTTAGSEVYGVAGSLNFDNSCTLSTDGGSALCAGKSWSESCRLPDSGPLLSPQPSGAPICGSGL